MALGFGASQREQMRGEWLRKALAGRPNAGHTRTATGVKLQLDDLMPAGAKVAHALNASPVLAVGSGRAAPQFLPRSKPPAAVCPLEPGVAAFLPKP